MSWVVSRLIFGIKLVPNPGLMPLISNQWHWQCAARALQTLSRSLIHQFDFWRFALIWSLTIFQNIFGFCVAATCGMLLPQFCPAAVALTLLCCSDFTLLCSASALLCSAVAAAALLWIYSSLLLLLLFWLYSALLLVLLLWLLRLHPGAFPSQIPKVRKN